MGNNLFYTSILTMTIGEIADLLDISFKRYKQSWARRDQVKWRGMEGESLGRDDWNCKVFGGQTMWIPSAVETSRILGGWP